MKTIKLSETKSMLKKIAKAKIKAEGEYFCMVGGEKVKVVKG